MRSSTTAVVGFGSREYTYPLRSMLNRPAAASALSNTNEVVRCSRYGAGAGGGVGRGPGVARQGIEPRSDGPAHGLLCLLWCPVVSGAGHCVLCCQSSFFSTSMKVSDILRVKGSTLFTVLDTPLAQAAETMAERDIRSLVVMEFGDLVGMLTFREVIQAVVGNGGSVGTRLVRSVMDDAPPTCTPRPRSTKSAAPMLGRHRATCRCSTAGS